MKTIDILVVRIYITESSGLLSKLVSYLKDTVKVRGVSVFRAISGFGDTGTHTSGLIDVSLDLPLVIEFFDEQEKVEEALEYLSTLIKSEHIIYWKATANWH